MVTLSVNHANFCTVPNYYCTSLLQLTNWEFHFPACNSNAIRDGLTIKWEFFFFFPTGALWYPVFSYNHCCCFSAKVFPTHVSCNMDSLQWVKAIRRIKYIVSCFPFLRLASYCRLVRYMYPTDEELKQLVGKSQHVKSKGKRSESRYIFIIIKILIPLPDVLNKYVLNVTCPEGQSFIIFM